MLRAIQAGLSLADLDFLEYGEVLDLIIESSNDHADYDRIAGPDDNMF